MKSQVFTLANALRKSGLSLSESVKRAWASLKLRASMAVTPTAFSYAKETGEIRNAVGYFSEPQSTATTSKPGTPSLAIKYYDTTVNGWRSFRADRLILA